MFRLSLLRLNNVVVMEDVVENELYQVGIKRILESLAREPPTDYSENPFSYSCKEEHLGDFQLSIYYKSICYIIKFINAL